MKLGGVAFQRLRRLYTPLSRPFPPLPYPSLFDPSSLRSSSSSLSPHLFFHSFYPVHLTVFHLCHSFLRSCKSGAMMFSLLVASVWLAVANAHLAAWHKGMFCLNGSANGQVDLNTAAPVTPLYDLPRNDWWFHHINGCDRVPPAPGDFLDIPAGSQFQVEIASNRAKTTLSYNGDETSDWPDGGHYPDNYNMPQCIIAPNMHTQNETMASGTAFAISYVSDINLVRPDNLVVFSVKYHTPWKRVTTYSVPPAMPACPRDGCICAWGWIPNGCGQANMYHQAFRCRVTGASSTTPVATPKPPVWCEGKPEQCVKGAKQMLYWHQKDGNNIEVSGLDLSGQPKSPGYNTKCGFSDGAQNDIFASGPNQLAAHPQPEGPSVSSQPSAASASSQPAASLASSAHSQPVAPSASSAHSQPAAPSAPSAHPQPAAPSTSSVHSQPAAPSASSVHPQPAASSASPAPSKPAAYSIPSRPASHSRPAIHPAPSRPATQSVHSRPVAHSVPSRPSSPSVPSHPAAHSAPSQTSAHPVASQPSPASCMKKKRLHKKKGSHARAHH